MSKYEEYQKAVSDLQVRKKMMGVITFDLRLDTIAIVFALEYQGRE